MSLIEVSGSPASTFLSNFGSIFQAIDNREYLDCFARLDCRARRSRFAAMNTGFLVIAKTSRDEPVSKVESTE